jgi:hypothetical protein
MIGFAVNNLAVAESCSVSNAVQVKRMPKR